MKFLQTRSKLFALALTGMICAIAAPSVTALAQSATQQPLPNRAALARMSVAQLKAFRIRLARSVQNRNIPTQQKRDMIFEVKLIDVELKRRRNARPAAPRPAAPRPTRFAVLSDNRPLASLSRPQLSSRDTALVSVIRSPNATPAQKRKARRLRAELRTEKARRRSAQNGQGGNLEAVLNDRRPARQLSDNQLRKRITRLTRLISSPRVSSSSKRRALLMRSIDRDEQDRRANSGAGNGREGQLARVLNDRRPASNLSLTQLRTRLVKLQRLIDSPDVRQGYKTRARAMRGRDRRELDRRNAQAGQGNGNLPPVLRNNRPVARMSLDQLRQRDTRLTRLITAQTSSPRIKREALFQRTLVRDELDRRRRAGAGGQDRRELVRVLNDRRPARDLSKTELKRRIIRLGRVIDSPLVANGQKSKARWMRTADRAELESRRGISNGPSIRQIAVLKDRRNPSGLSTQALRDRVREIRRQLRRNDLPPSIRTRLSKKLRADRAELRIRVANQRRPSTGRNTDRDDYAGYARPGNRNATLEQAARRLASDFRQARRLSRQALSHRIKAARQVLKYVNLHPADRRHITNMIRLDRAEKRRRLFAAREQRRVRQDQLRAQGRLNVDIRVFDDRRPPRDITAAEADDLAIRRQLLTRQRYQPERRYSRYELTQRPELTRSLPGIDVDTINFGFGEAFIREEEIDDLERMAITIERILAARPYEVFQIEGHTDAVGSAQYNYRLSVQRAKAVKNALIKFFIIPPQALVTIGLGETYLKIPTQMPEAENRRVTIRRITPILRR